MAETTTRLLIFIGVLLTMFAWEGLAGLQRTARDNWHRRATNLLLVSLGNAGSRLLMPAGLVAVAALAARQGIGLLNVRILPAWLSWAVAVLALDLAVYWQHRLTHQAPLLWRLHSVHHADRGFDVTTGFRFHPVEIMLSLLWKATVVMALGAPAGAIILFELILSTSALFNHGNVLLPARIEAALRQLVVTPSLHRIHHSLLPDERENNFGFSLSCWDRLFGTFRAASRQPESDMLFGLRGVSPESATSLWAMLRRPFESARASEAPAAPGP